jgi:hypothetical protein
VERDASRARLSSTLPSSPVRSMTVSLSGLEANVKAVKKGSGQRRGHKKTDEGEYSGE